MVCCPELLLSPKCYDEVSCGDIVSRPVLWGRLGRFWKGQTRLLHWKAGNLLSRNFLSYALEKGQQEKIKECVFHWSKRVNDVGGDFLHK